MERPRAVGLVGSPRKGRNTDTLVDRVLDGCRAAGASSHLGDLDIHPCRACRDQDGSGCRHRDDMDRLYDVFEHADALVLATPVYYATVSSQMKLVIDRSYCLGRPVIRPSGERAYESGVKRAKSGLVVSVGGSRINPECVLPVFELWAPEVNLTIVDSLLVTHAQLGRPPMESEEVLTEAFAKGAALGRRLRKRAP